MESRPLDGEHDCLLGLPVGPGSTDDERPLARGLPLDADNGLSGAVVLRFGGASIENPGMSDGFQGLFFMVGEGSRDGAKLLGTELTDLAEDETGVFVGVVPDGLANEVPEFTDLVKKDEDRERRPVVLFELGEADGRRVGVDDLDNGFDAGIEARPVGVDDLATGLDKGVVDLVGPADLDVTGIAGLFENKVAREVGVEGLEFLDVAATVGRPVGVAGLDDVDVNDGLPVGVAGLDPPPPDDEGLRIPMLEDTGHEDGCLETKPFLFGISIWGLAS